MPAKRSRCYVCGLTLATGSQCPKHPAAAMIEWPHRYGLVAGTILAVVNQEAPRSLDDWASARPARGEEPDSYYPAVFREDAIDVLGHMRRWFPSELREDRFAAEPRPQTLFGRK